MTTAAILGGLQRPTWSQSISFDGTNNLNTYTPFVTWNPVLQFGGASTGITYTLQTNFYSKIGLDVFFTMTIVLSNVGSATGNATIANLPFTVINVPSYIPVISGGCANVTLGVGYTTILLSPVSGTTTANLVATGGPVGIAQALLTNAAFTNTSTLYFSGTYVAST